MNPNDQRPIGSKWLNFRSVNIAALNLPFNVLNEGPQTFKDLAYGLDMVYQTSSRKIHENKSFIHSLKQGIFQVPFFQDIVFANWT